MKKVLSILVFTLFCVGGVFAKSTVKVTVKLSSTSTGMGYVTYSTSSTPNETYTTTSGTKSNSSSGGILGWGATSTNPYYIFARTADSQKYYFIGWSKGVDNPSQIDTSIPRNGYQVGGSYAHGDNVTVDETYYAHFREIQAWNIVLKQVAEGGSYSVTHTLNSVSKSYPVNTTSGDVEIPAFTDPKSAELTLTATAASNYRFYRWCIDYGDEKAYDNRQNPTLTVAQSATISCEFVRKEYAQFVVMGENNSYVYLSDAIAAAKASASKVVVLKESGKLYVETETTTYFDAATKKYTIPSDITLLIPNGNEYVVHMGNISGAQVTASTEKFTEEKCLEVDAEQDFEVHGKICIYANIEAGKGAIKHYGRIHLGNDSHIVLKSGSKLNALGFVTGHENSFVEIESDAVVQEIIQISDWRGGNAMSNIVTGSGKANKVFPLSQYYVQNIETKLIAHDGAVANVTSLATVSSFNFPMSATLFSPASGNYTGMFRLGSGVVLERYYDIARDRICYTARLAEGATSATISWDKILLNLESEDDGISGAAAEAILRSMGLKDISSADYVLPITNNMDIRIGEGIIVDIKEEVALLAGSTLRIDKGAELQTSNDASIYVYDANQHHVQYDGETKSQSVTDDKEKVTDTSIRKSYYYNYFGAGSLPMYKVANRPGGLQYHRDAMELEEWKNPDASDPDNITKLHVYDAQIILNGTFNGTIYTTKDGASIISDDPTTNAKLTFAASLPAPSIKQIIQKAYNTAAGGSQSQTVVFSSIPCLPSAALLNADGSYSAGGSANDEQGETYTYYPLWNNGADKPKGRWSLTPPQGVITPLELTGNSVQVTIPEIKPGSITFTPEATETQIQSLDATKTAFSGGRFASDGAATYTNGVVTIPIKYSPTNVHGDNITDVNPETVTVYFNCHNSVSNLDEVVAVSIDLTAEQDYTPDFRVNDKEDEIITLNFGDVTVGNSSAEQTITVTTIENNVTDRNKNEGKGYVTWNPTTLSVNPPFVVESANYFEGAKVVYKPTTTAGTVNDIHSQEITIKATYSDGVEMTKRIVLQGKPFLAQNPLKFVADSREIYPGDVINPLFHSTGNGETITFTYNDDEASDIVEIVKTADNYQLQVKNNVNIITPQVIRIVATQPYNNVTSTGSATIEVTVTPSVQWNWSKLYFGNSYSNPIVVKNDDPWSLTYNNDCAAIPIANFTGDAVNGYYIEVGTGNECTATFTFKQGTYTYTFESKVYADPRILDICLRDDKAGRTYEGITIEETNVRFENGILFATTEQTGAAWTMEVIGIPDKMEFTPQGEGKRWIIDEYDGTNWNTTHTEAEISLAAGQSYYVHNLKASTQQIRVICSQGATQGKITNLCVYALDASASADMDKLYMPIVKDENGATIQSQKSVVLSYVSPSSPLKLSVVDGSGNVVADVTLSGDNLSATHQLPATDVNNLYREETIVVSSTHATEGTVYLLVQDKDNKEMLKLPIRLYEYPQPLPIRTADWKNNNAEKYYFYTDFEHSQNVQFNVVTQKLTFASTGSNQRFITFVFRGGPSYISFESSLDFVPQDDVTAEQLVLQEWYDYWTLEVTDGESPRLIANNAEAEVQPEIVAEVRDGRTYFQIRVAIPYTTKSLTLQSKRALAVEVENLVIDGEPDLDVVLGNHTIEHETEVNFTPDVPDGEVVVTAINLEQLKVACNNSHFTVTYNTNNITVTPTTLTSSDCPNALGNYMVGNISLHVTWDGINVVEEGVLIFTDKNDQTLATIRLLGAKDYILKGNSENTGLFTGFATNITTHPFTAEKKKYQYARRQVNLSNTFDKNGVALFDYLIVYGETTADDLGSTIIDANKTRGSNAHTPMYVYRKAKNTEGVYDRYQFVFDQANVNQGEKPVLHSVVDVESQQMIPHAKETEGTQYIDIAEGEQLRVYMTGFCPYASTGFDKTQEGVWLFRAKKNAKLDIYLEDCHIYSRNKTRDGHDFTEKQDPGADIFQELYSRGSGGVLVFENNDNREYTANEAFQVTVHTRGTNLLKSGHGCFYEFLGVRAYQVSSPIQIRMTSDQFYVQNSKTHLTFDDKWPDDVTNYESSDRTNGFLSLQKRNNNAPSIDMGNGNTVVNFRGGQVELQNAQNVSDKYKTTLAISYRSGIMASGGIEVQMAHGLGTDAATLGTVNFYDGTISVIKMYVDPKDRKYYLMDPLIQNGDTVKDAEGNVVLSDSTSCLRCPQHTYVYGGSICMLRTCMSPTSQGGAPTDGVSPLGRFFYKEEYGYEYNTQDKQKPANNDDASQWLVNPEKFPSDITLFEGLEDYLRNIGKYSYGISSVTPNEDGQLVLWLPNGYGGVKAEQDRYITAWKACMPEITAILTQVGTTVVGGTVGGPTGVANIEDVDNLLYCDMDEHIYRVITAKTGEGENEKYIYEAPLKVPEGFQMADIDLGIGDYLRLAPSHVADDIDAHEMTNEEDYNINSKVYYVSSAIADIWQTFTAPFDVERIWVVETYDENALAQTQLTEEDVQNGLNKRQKILTVQANHNADFAAFFGVAMALGSEKSFDEIFDEYMEWAMIEDKHEGSLDTYTKRGRIELQAYDGTNWADAHFYMYHNEGNWTIDNADQGKFNTKWEYVKKEGNVLLKKGETYSMLFPYCTGCWENNDESKRKYWDYWSGKLIIFESTQASKDKPHTLRGSNYVAATRPAKGDWIFANDEVLNENEYPEVVVTGNSSLAHMNTNRTDVFVFDPTPNLEAFLPIHKGRTQTIYPTTAFLYGYVPTDAQGMPARGVKRTGEIIYDKENTSTDVNPGGNIPTVGDGNDLFITSTMEGINIAVAEPQHVRVMSATGVLLFNGMVQTAVDVALPATGVYVITGENEVHKILH